MNETDEFRVRQFREADVGSVRRLIHYTIDECYSGTYPPRAVQFFCDFHSEAKIMERHRAGETLVVEQRGRVIGTGAVVKGEILGVFVHPDAQRRGIGRILMRELETRAKARGYEVAELSVSLPSRVFYERLGYEIVEECSIDVGEGETLYFWKARKVLDA